MKQASDVFKKKTLSGPGSYVAGSDGTSAALAPVAVHDQPGCRRPWTAAAPAGGPVEVQRAPELLAAAPVGSNVSFRFTDCIPDSRFL